MSDHPTGTPVNFYSEGLRLAGLMHYPADYQPGERRPAVIIAHGRLAIKEWVPSRWIPYFLDAGCICLSFDYRNLGQSEGTLGTVIPQEEVRDLRAAVTFLMEQDGVDRNAVGVLGWGLGGGVAVVAAAEDERIKAVVCASGVANGEAYGRDELTHEQWLARQREIEQDRVRQVLTGKSSPLSDDEFPAAKSAGDPKKEGGYLESLRRALGITDESVDLPALGIPERLDYRSMDALYKFRPVDVVHRIAPRPLLAIHAVDDGHFSFDAVIELYENAGAPKELIGIPNSGHLRWIDPEYPEQAVYVPRVVDWMTTRLRESADRAIPGVELAELSG